MLGFTSVGGSFSQHISSIEPPALFILDDKPVVFYGIRKSEAIIASPEVGIYRVNLESLSSSFGERLRFVLPRRSFYSNQSFWLELVHPLLKKYKKPCSCFCFFTLSTAFWLSNPFIASADY